jgi:hypothetical protein
MFVEKSVRVPSGGQPYDLKVDAVGNVYALDGNSGIVKYSADLEVIWTMACPSADGAHINRALVLDEFGACYAAVTEGGDHKTSRIWCVEPDPEFLNVRSGGKEQDKGRLRWQLQMDKVDTRTDEPYGHGHIGGMRVRNGTLYTVQNDPDERRSWIVTYGQIDTANPVVLNSKEVPWPCHDIEAYSNGDMVICSPSTTGRGDNPKYSNITDRAFPGDIWHPERDLTNYDSRLWCWLSCNELMPDGSDPLDTYEDPTTGEEKFLRWKDRSGNGRDLVVASGDDAPSVVTGLGGKRALEFRGTEALASLVNSVTAKANSKSQRQILPSYTDAAFCVVMVVEMEHSAGDQHVWLWQDTATNFAIIANRGEAAADDYQVDGFLTVYDNPASGGSGLQGGWPYQARFDKDDTGSVSGGTVTARDPVGGIVTVYNNGGLSGAPDSFFRFNGCPFDQWVSPAFASTTATEVGKASTGAGAWDYATGRIYEIFVLDRQDYDDDTAEVVESPGTPTGTTTGSDLGLGFIDIEVPGTLWGVSSSGSLTIDAPPTGGTQAAATATYYSDAAQVLRRITITNPGDGYTTAPAVSGPGAGETLTAYMYEVDSPTEIENIEGYFTHSYGIQHLLDDDGGGAGTTRKYVLYGQGLTAAGLRNVGENADTHGCNSAFEHPYHYDKPVPDDSSVTGNELAITYLDSAHLAIKYGADEGTPIKWIVQDYTDGRIGYGLSLEERDDLLGAATQKVADIFTVGVGGGTSKGLGTIADKGDSAAFGALGTVATIGDDTTNEYTRMSRDDFKYVYVPWLSDSYVTGNHQSVLLYGQNNHLGWRENDDNLSNNQSAYAAAVSPAPLPYTYENEDGTIKRAYDRTTALVGDERPVHMYVALASDSDERRLTDAGGLTEQTTIAKVRLIKETPGGNVPRRAVHFAVADDGNFYKMRRGAGWTTTGTEDADWDAPDSAVTLSTDVATLYSGAVLNGKVYVCDGGGGQSSSRTGSIHVYAPSPVGSDEKFQALVAKFGKAPENPAYLSAWRDRLVAIRGSNWLMSASGDPRDWDFYPPVPLPTSAISDQLTSKGP